MTDAAPLPTFLVIGAQKSATRWLKANLSEHPDVYVVADEISYFDSPHRVREDGPAWYREQFAGCTGQPVVGEGTPGYMIWHRRPADVAERVEQLVPDVRLVALVRNPVDRAVSAFVHHQRRGRIDRGADLVELVRRAAPDLADGRHPPERCVYGWGGPQTLVTGGWYGASLAPFVERFGAQLQIVVHDDVVAEPGLVYRAVLEHLGADPDFVPTDLPAQRFSNSAGRRRWRASGPPPLSLDQRCELYELFRHDVAELERLTGRDFGMWDPAGGPEPRHDRSPDQGGRLGVEGRPDAGQAHPGGA